MAPSYTETLSSEEGHKPYYVDADGRPRSPHSMRRGSYSRRHGSTDSEQAKSYGRSGKSSFKHGSSSRQGSNRRPSEHGRGKRVHLREPIFSPPHQRRMSEPRQGPSPRTFYGNPAGGLSRAYQQSTVQGHPYSNPTPPVQNDFAQPPETALVVEQRIATLKLVDREKVKATEEAKEAARQSLEIEKRAVQERLAREKDLQTIMEKLSQLQGVIVVEREQQRRQMEEYERATKRAEESITNREQVRDTQEKATQKQIRELKDEIKGEIRDFKFQILQHMGLGTEPLYADERELVIAGPAEDDMPDQMSQYLADHRMSEASHDQHPQYRRQSISSWEFPMSSKHYRELPSSHSCKCQTATISHHSGQPSHSGTIIPPVAQRLREEYSTTDDREARRSRYRDSSDACILSDTNNRIASKLPNHAFFFKERSNVSVTDDLGGDQKGTITSTAIIEQDESNNRNWSRGNPGSNPKETDVDDRISRSIQLNPNAPVFYPGEDLGTRGNELVQDKETLEAQASKDRDPNNPSEPAEPSQNSLIDALDYQVDSFGSDRSEEWYDTDNSSEHEREDRRKVYGSHARSNYESESIPRRPRKPSRGSNGRQRRWQHENRWRPPPDDGDGEDEDGPLVPCVFLPLGYVQKNMQSIGLSTRGEPSRSKKKRS
ncbi:hypothetical protein NPX13_g4172 [Xylaria arbuscula]|uniref:Uncharacterized protein n=1 Tax=Xylaria arbuscula TaxID=114810 RepID=A0A9W8TM64_9PEZI|nr:hypothetical protein NPX13_g4172 [Xylaria arbuscula]